MSDIDSNKEKALTAAIIDASKSGATIIVVSHRPSLLASTDFIAVLNQGNLVKFGPRDGVLQELGGGKLTGSSITKPANSE